MPPRSLRFFRTILLTATCCGVGAHAADAVLRPGQQPVGALPITAHIKIPEGPAWLESGFGSLWVSSVNGKQVLRIDPDTNKVIASIRIDSKPALAIGMGLGSIWVADSKDKSIEQIDPTTNQVVHKITVNLPREMEGSLGVGEGSLWALTNEGDTESGTLTRLDPKSGEIVANIQVNAQSHAAVVAFGSVWVSSTAGGSVLRVDARNNTVVAEIPVHASPRFLTADDSSVWVLSQGDGSLARIDPLTNKVAATIDVGALGLGGDVSSADHYVWVSAEGIPLSQIDAKTNRLLRQFAGGKRDDKLRVAFGAAWIADQLHGEIWRVDLARLQELPSL